MDLWNVENATERLLTIVDEISENNFEVTGKVTVRDKYGDTYTGNYDAVVEYNPTTNECEVDCDIGILYKN